MKNYFKCNTTGSGIPRALGAVLYTNASREIEMVSTKAFLAQPTAAYLLGTYPAELRGKIFSCQIKDALANLKKFSVRRSNHPGQRRLVP